MVDKQTLQYKFLLDLIYQFICTLKKDIDFYQPCNNKEKMELKDDVINYYEFVIKTYKKHFERILKVSRGKNTKEMCALLEELEKYNRKSFKSQNS